MLCSCDPPCVVEGVASVSDPWPEGIRDVGKDCRSISEDPVVVSRASPGLTIMPSDWEGILSWAIGEIVGGRDDP